MSRRSLPVDDLLHAYLIDHSLREHPAQPALREATAAHPHAGMQIAPEQGQFMALLVKLIGARRAIEVGVFTGYSALTVALALPDDGELLACDISEDYTGSAGRSGARPASRTRSTCVSAPARETLDARLADGEAGRYDFAFIDADKASYDALLRMLPAAAAAGRLDRDRQHAVGRRVARPASEPTRSRCRRSTSSCTTTRASICRCCRSATA